MRERERERERERAREREREWARMSENEREWEREMHTRGTRSKARGVCWIMLTYAYCMLTYADAYGRMLKYSDVCWLHADFMHTRGTRSKARGLCKRKETQPLTITAKMAASALCLLADTLCLMPTCWHTLPYAEIQPLTLTAKIAAPLPAANCSPDIKCMLTPA
jgi:hypothetical protein